MYLWCHQKSIVTASAECKQSEWDMETCERFIFLLSGMGSLCQAKKLIINVLYCQMFICSLNCYFEYMHKKCILSLYYTYVCLIISYKILHWKQGWCINTPPKSVYVICGTKWYIHKRWLTPPPPPPPPSLNCYFEYNMYRKCILSLYYTYVCLITSKKILHWKQGWCINAERHTPP